MRGLVLQATTAFRHREGKEKHIEANVAAFRAGIEAGKKAPSEVHA